MKDKQGKTKPAPKHVARIEQVKAGGKYPRRTTLDVEARTGTISHVTKLDNGVKVWLEHEFDLSQTSMEEILTHAIADMVIKKRNKAFKQHTEPKLRELFEAGYVFRPEDYPAERANGLSAEEKMNRASKKLSRNEKIAWLTAKSIPHEQAVAIVDSGNF